MRDVIYMCIHACFIHCIYFVFVYLYIHYLYNVGLIDGDGSIVPYKQTGKSQKHQQDSVAAYFEFETPRSVSGSGSNSNSNAKSRNNGNTTNNSSDYHIYMTIGSSFVSCEGARNNVIHELNTFSPARSAGVDIFDDSDYTSMPVSILFDRIKMNVSNIWNEYLSRITVSNQNVDSIYIGDIDSDIDSDSDRFIVFYTALWHSLLLPRIASDANGDYIAFDTHTRSHIHTNDTDDTYGVPVVMHASGYVYMDDFSMWDIVRAQVPLLHLVYTDHTVDMVQSLVAKAQQGGWMPIFPAWNSYTSEMIGDHCCVLIADALHKHILDFSDEIAMAAYTYCQKNALNHPTTVEKYQGKGRKGVESYHIYGFIPLEDTISDAPHTNQQVSRTLEYAYNDYVVSQWGAVLLLLSRDSNRASRSSRSSSSSSSSNNNTAIVTIEDIELLLNRSYNYRNVWDSSVGFIRGRYEDGTWYGNDENDENEEEVFDPVMHYSWLTETDVWQYTWYTPHNVEDLMNLVSNSNNNSSSNNSNNSSNNGFAVKLDEFFDDSHYNHGNEPDHHVAYLYTYINRNGSGTETDSGSNSDSSGSDSGAWRTQEIVRNILDTEYSASPGGLSGNDDAGQMSAWYVLSAVGLYQVCPGCGGYSEYTITTPLFEYSTLTLPNSKLFTIKTIKTSNNDIYIQSLSLNGSPYNCAFIAYNRVMEGGLLIMQLGPLPNKKWGDLGRDCL